MTRQEGQWSTAANYAGGDGVGATWTDKVMAVKASVPAAAAADTGDDVVGDDEWVSGCQRFISLDWKIDTTFVCFFTSHLILLPFSSFISSVCVLFSFLI